jgi:hypothetical protein
MFGGRTVFILSPMLLLPFMMWIVRNPRTNDPGPTRNGSEPMTFRQRLAHFTTQNGTATTVLLLIAAAVGIRGLVSLIIGVSASKWVIVVVSAVNVLLGAGGVWVLVRARREGRRRT